MSKNATYTTELPAELLGSLHRYRLPLAESETIADILENGWDAEHPAKISMMAGRGANITEGKHRIGSMIASNRPDFMVPVEITYKLPRTISAPADS